MPESIMVEVDGGKKLRLKYKDMNCLAIELMDSVPLPVLRKWIQESKHFTPEFKARILEKNEEEVKTILFIPLGYHPQLNRYAPYLKEEEI